jgi:hypothetical protein
MNDPIKDFIEKNRAEFDHLEAPAFDMNKFKARAPVIATDKTQTVKLIPALKLLPTLKWFAAASVLIATATFLFLSEDKQAVKDLAPQTAQLSPNGLPVKSPPRESASTPIYKEVTPVYKDSTSMQIQRLEAVGYTHRKRNKPTAVIPHTDTESLFEQLADSSSASTRLAAILEIKKQGTLSNYVISRLATSLNTDNNSNVRLAALDLLGRYSKEKYVSSVLVSSLGTQTDPMVQLELVTLLGNMEHLKIEDKLYALAADPNTFGAVKDEAYSILLNQNRL